MVCLRAKNKRRNGPSTKSKIAFFGMFFDNERVMPIDYQFCKCACISTLVLISLEDDTIGLAKSDEEFFNQLREAVDAVDLIQSFDLFAQQLLEMEIAFESQSLSNAKHDDNKVALVRQQIADSFLRDFRQTIFPKVTSTTSSDLNTAFACYAIYILCAGRFVATLCNFLSEQGIDLEDSFSLLQKSKIDILENLESWLTTICKNCNIEKTYCKAFISNFESVGEFVSSTWYRLISFASDQMT